MSPPLTRRFDRHSDVDDMLATCFVLRNPDAEDMRRELMLGRFQTKQKTLCS